MWLLVFDILRVLCIKFVRNDFSVPFNNDPDNFKEGKLLSLFFSKVFSVEFDEFQENGF